MHCGNWHFVGACLLSLTLALAGNASAQDCPNCVGGSTGSYSGVTHEYGGNYCSQGSCGQGSCGQGTACTPFGTCASKRDHWYLPYTEQSQPDLFYNFYVPNHCGSPAAAYPAPYPTPNLVGHTYITYQPLMPHEWLYKHHRSYHQYYNNGMGLNRTKVKWQGTPVLTAVKGVRNVFRLPR
ncbi:MAG: hypothetical protein GY768_07725 [Planctomycetaceae bacterium]|nr:hypothetical protein [Planctomycetaceae bacterium]